MKYYREELYLKGLKMFDEGADVVIITNQYEETKTVTDVKSFKFYYKTSSLLDETITEVFGLKKVGKQYKIL